MKKYLTVAAGLIVGATLMFAAAPSMATEVDINVGIPGVHVQPQPVYVQPHPVYVQPRPVYIQPQHENEWRERQLRAVEWRDNPNNHGRAAAVHERNEDRRENRRSYRGEGRHGD